MEEKNIKTVQDVESIQSRIKKFFKYIKEKDSFLEVYYLFIDNVTLFLGVILVSTSILNFSHDKYCDGTPANYYECVNPATYYEYSNIVIFLFALGFVLIAFWYVKRNTTIIHE